ncbi:MAG: hypothetical protein K0S23_1304 [Fluviicola sp.]|jgi:hypothetical protein|uniref:hypothetical protein n=1 Tax=Fluviicola sp. TaxID=1917219 RepID=UPI002612BB9B|nr:hypothetical protein [Fluviicola sp.]MDF3026997.1 hypothetical protein [Fluviicola sp.]
MKSRDGHSRKDRLDRLHVPGTFKMLDNDKAAMLQKLIRIAGWIRFYNEKEIPEGYFEDFLGELEALRENIQMKHAHEAIGKMEPSQALLLAFIENLQKVTEKYNGRWNDFANWYLTEYLKVSPLSVKGDRVWLAFDKATPGTITIEKNTGFNRKNTDQNVLTYRLENELVVQDIEALSAYTVCFERNPYHYPAANLNFVTAIKTRDLLHDKPVQDRTLIFDNEFSRETRAIGIRIAAPSLLLREGKRVVNIYFEAENKEWLKTLQKIEPQLVKLELVKLKWEKLKWEKQRLESLNTTDLQIAKQLKLVKEELAKIKLSNLKGHKLKFTKQELSALKLDRRELTRVQGVRQKIRANIFNNLFYITISTPTGWTNVTIFEVKKDTTRNRLILKFLLPEDFPSTVGCTEEVHHFQSEFPAIQIRLNFDAWLYPYSWIHKLRIQRILIRTKVEGINDVQVYNELGKIDNSKSFPPFGINTSAGTWMAIGNYEMAIKNTSSIDICVKWNQLPLHPKGLKGHYAAYPGQIDNNSFKIRTRYLSDNSWFPTTGKSGFSLFRDAEVDDPNAAKLDKAVSDESDFPKISVKKMVPFEHSEDTYKYTIKTRTGFVKLTLESPDMGFGSQEYRDLFTERMMMKKWRKKRLPVLLPPIFPHVENITLNYRSEDIIDLRKNTRNSHVLVDQLHPFGVVSSVDSSTNTGIPFVFSQQTDASILMGFKNVKGDEVFSTFIVFEAVSNEMTVDDIPKIIMYWGDGYHWEEIPRGFILKDETKQMTVSGNLVYHFPPHIPPNLYDKDGVLWIRTGFVKNHEFVPEIRAVYNNAGLVVLETDEASVEKMQSFKNSNGLLEPEKKLPGITSIEQITSYYAGQELEDLKSMQVRVSEFVTHRGRAVTARDFELLTLQEFSDIGKVLCLPNTNLKNDKQGVVTVVVIPQNKLKTINNSKPMVPSGLLSRIEDYLSERASKNVIVDVVNPVYEELQVKCVIRLKDENQAVSLEAIQEICDNFIAPWQAKNVLPKFGEPIHISRIYNAIKEIDFVAEIDYFAIIRVSQDKTEAGKRNYYHLYTHEEEAELLVPNRPYKLFVPAETHIIQIEEKNKSIDPYGLGDMEIGKTFIL